MARKIWCGTFNNKCSFRIWCCNVSWNERKRIFWIYVSYTAYERLFYVTNVEDSAYQFLNVNVPDGATQQTPIFLSANIPLFRKGRELSLGIMPYYHFSGMRLKEDFGLNFGADHHRYGAIVMGTASTRLFGSKNTVDFLWCDIVPQGYALS